MQLANEVLEMTKLFTESLSEAFTMSEVVPRLTSMLNIPILSSFHNEPPNL